MSDGRITEATRALLASLGPRKKQARRPHVLACLTELAAEIIWLTPTNEQLLRLADKHPPDAS